MSEIKSHEKDYEFLQGYVRPEDVDTSPYPPQTEEEIALYQAAHAMVSERHEKYDLIRVMYAVLHREATAERTARVAAQTDVLRTVVARHPKLAGYMAREMGYACVEDFALTNNVTDLI